MRNITINISKDKFLPCYWHLLDKSKFFDIEFLYGGRDSGKSRHTAQQLITNCLSNKYFKCLLIRKILNTIRDSQYSLIKSVIDEWQLNKYFKFNDTRMEITCTLNGNGFFGRGLDDAGRIKSFNNPSHCWIEEGNQITNDDFVVILTSLRANQHVQTFYTFNPECDVNYTEFWLWQEWFSHTTELSWVWHKVISTDNGDITISARATHTTYKDNTYCKPQRIALYESYKSSKNNAYWYQTYTLGLWGFKRTGDPFWPCFDEEKHVKDIEYDKDALVHVVVDNNVSPYIAIQIWQMRSSKKIINQIHEIPCSSPNNTAAKAALKLIKWLDSVNYKNRVMLYGDPSANARSTNDDSGRSFFDKFKNELQKAGYAVIDKIKKSAPNVALSGDFINEIYESNFMGWTININTYCRTSIEDYIMVKKESDGTMQKKRTTDSDTKISYEKHGHMSDNKRYFITTVLEYEFKVFGSRRNKFMGYAV